ncbi:hypothetical protein [Actinotalea fermentans]|uniref:Lipoprotein n=1 Tax=Actinotalea fermentans TaxID=43671 RepID=A0A511YU20_9CELL|nr:hypothetical protein [Actinotalea fermentans]KGM15433.1 hypothetical protein N867_08455 [Actinotalea fermentans ATCC 43279 = JCM 9966 = DSM 3133]GEN78698.1 hypothetical protein AFE02nite_04320 [Actinotalea fermentans]
MASWAAGAARRAGRGATVARARSTVVTLLVLACAACAGGNDPTDAGADAGADAAAAEDLTTLSAPETPEPTATSPEPLVTAEPDEYSEVGDLVEGFPIELLPVPGDAVILVTSAVPVGNADVQEVSLNLRTAATAAELLELYRGALTAAGFSEVTGETADSDLAAQVTFVRSGGDEVVSIGVLDVDGARTVTIGGRVRTSES